MFSSFLTGGKRNASQQDAGRGEPTLADVDPYYGSMLEQQDPRHTEGRQAEQSDPNALGPQAVNPQVLADIQRRLDEYDKRLRDKDSHISRLEGQNQSLTALVTSLNQRGGGSPSVEEADPPFLDEDTKALLAKRIQEDPADAVAALVEYADRRAQNRIQAEIEKINAKNQVRDSNAQAQQNFMSQLQAAVREMGSEAEMLITDMMTSPNPANTPLGAALAQDPEVAKTRTGVYQLIKAMVLQGRASAPAVSQREDLSHRDEYAAMGIPTTDAADRRVGREEVRGPSVEDQIGDAITRAGRHTQDEALRKLFG